MSWRVAIRATAQQDLLLARDWYEQRRAGLGSEFLLAVTDAMLALEESPLRQPLYYRDFRRLMTDRFPYKIFYRVDDQDVIVFRILHAARDHSQQLE